MATGWKKANKESWFQVLPLVSCSVLASFTGELDCFLPTPLTSDMTFCRGGLVDARLLYVTHLQRSTYISLLTVTHIHQLITHSHPFEYCIDLILVSETIILHRLLLITWL